MTLLRHTAVDCPAHCQLSLSHSRLISSSVCSAQLQNAAPCIGEALALVQLRQGHTVLSCRSVFYLPPPKPLNYLVQDLYGGPCMVLQGALDPLNDARARAAALQAACSNVEVQLIGGGHCPVCSS